MVGDTVIIKRQIADKARKQKAVTKLELYKIAGVCKATGAKFFNGTPIHLKTAKKIAAASCLKSL